MQEWKPWGRKWRRQWKFSGRSCVLCALLQWPYMPGACFSTFAMHEVEYESCSTHMSNIGSTTRYTLPDIIMDWVPMPSGLCHIRPPGCVNRTSLVSRISCRCTSDWRCCVGLRRLVDLTSETIMVTGTSAQEMVMATVSNDSPLLLDCQKLLLCFPRAISS